MLPYGYPLERHSTTTPDGYILTVLRVPHGVPGSSGKTVHSSTPTQPSTQTGARPQSGFLTGMLNFIQYAFGEVFNAFTGPPGPAHRAGRSDEQIRAVGMHEADLPAAQPRSNNLISVDSKQSAGADAEASAGVSNNTAAGHNGRPVVLLGHGLLDSAAGFLVNGPGASLGFLLADAGYDVWLTNWRGNTLSRNHTTLSPTDARYWAFSYDEMARYDLPTILEYVLNATGVELTSASSLHC